MARKLRVEYPGAIYHVMSRGDRREPIFKGNPDRVAFLQTLAQGYEETGRQVLAYCLMPKHVHMVVETPQGNLVAGMKGSSGVREGGGLALWGGVAGVGGGEGGADCESGVGAAAVDGGTAGGSAEGGPGEVGDCVAVAGGR